jgi:hypothetical protein
MVIHLHSPRMRRTSLTSFSINVTRLECIITKTESSKSWTIIASEATCSASTAVAVNLIVLIT